MNLAWLAFLPHARAAVVAIILPPSEKAADWSEELVMAGLVPAAAATGPHVEVQVEGERWRVRALDGRGKVREVVVNAPRDDGAREDVAFLAASLVRPMSAAISGTVPLATPVPPAATNPPVAPPVTARPPAAATAKATTTPTPTPTTTTTTTTTTTPVATPVTTSTSIAVAPVAVAPVAVAPVETAPTPPPPVASAPGADPSLPTPWTTEPGTPPAPPAVTAPESVVAIERAPRPWSLGAGASVGATVRLDTDVSPSLGMAARLDNEFIGLGLRVTWLAPSTVSDVDAAPTLGETTSVLSLAWLPGDALLAAEAGASFLTVWDAAGDARGDLVVAPLLGARAGWRIRPGAGWAVEPFVGAEYLARKVSLLTVAEGKTTLAPARLRAGVTAYFSPGGA